MYLYKRKPGDEKEEFQVRPSFAVDQDQDIFDVDQRNCESSDMVQCQYAPNIMLYLEDV